MTDIEISKALALAIGWTEDRRDENGCLDPDVITEGALFGQEDGVFVWVDGSMWKRFDYRDPAVIWPIAERYNAFPNNIWPDWECLRWHPEKINGNARGWVRYTDDTAAKAVALAVIGRPA